ncbi:hypothetical protein [Natronomonas marina]|jgi:hypothetical protein|uniref:hypothetical protein n=1 Tax=Natronomonas marina TaxID=2961939 RepID=UPI0020C98EEC|nr:hypothetical protein [Natronomonas marina]
MTTVLNGLLGGLLVGVLAATVTRSVDTEPSAWAARTTDALGVRTVAARWLDGATRVAYGGVGGGALVALELYVLGVLAVPPTVGEAFGMAVAWSALLFAVRVLFARVGPSPDRSRLVAPLVYHLVYGLGLGVWIRLTWIT